MSQSISENMVFEDISYAIIFGKPLIFWLGTATLITLLTVATIGYLVHHGNKNVKFEWHKYLAFTLVIIAIIHGTLGLLHYI